jgi:ubiquinone biosynthesis protein Coq4
MSYTTDLPEYTAPGGVVPGKPSLSALLSCWRAFALTSDEHFGRVYEGYLELQTAANSRLFDQVRAHPNGRKLMRYKPELRARLHDDEYLASLPVGSVGHAFRAFLNTNRFDVGVFDEASVIRPIAERRNWDEDFYYFMVRYLTLHDMFHVIGGYSPDVAGEVTMVGFHCGQVEPAGLLEKFGYLMALGVPGAPVQHRIRVYRQAIERGRRADKLVAAPWEELLERPLDEVRELLGVAPTRVAHPDGLWFTTWTATGTKAWSGSDGKVASKWDYEAILARETAQGSAQPSTRD